MVDRAEKRRGVPLWMWMIASVLNGALLVAGLYSREPIPTLAGFSGVCWSAIFIISRLEEAK